MSDAYISGIPGKNIKSDCLVRYEPGGSGQIAVEITSKVAAMYGDAIHAQAREVLGQLGIRNGRLFIEDGGALPFVIAARVEAAVKAAHPDLTDEALPPLSPFDHQPSVRGRYRRSRLYLPGSQPKLMLNAGIHRPDGIILDLEDSVSPIEKASARFIVRNALRTLDFFGCERMVRVNQGELGLEDLDAIVPQSVQLLLLPKIESADEIVAVEERIASIKAKCGRDEPIWLMPILESAGGILQAREIAAASPNIVSLAIGLEDYTADIGVERTEDGAESLFARGMLVNAAKAAGIQAIATVYSDVQNMDGLMAAAKEARSLGYDGMGAIHPRQIAVIHEAFAPTDSEIEKARRIVLAFDEAQAKGLGVVSLGTKMIDPPVVKRAQRTVDMALASDRLPKNWKEEQRTS